MEGQARLLCRSQEGLSTLGSFTSPVALRVVRELDFAALWAGKLKLYLGVYWLINFYGSQVGRSRSPVQTLPMVGGLGSGLSISRPHSSVQAFFDSSAWLGMSGLPRAGIWVYRDFPRRQQPPLCPVSRYLSMHCGATAVRTCWGLCSWLASTSSLRYLAWLHVWSGWRAGSECQGCGYGTHGTHGPEVGTSVPTLPNNTIVKNLESTKPRKESPTPSTPTPLSAARFCVVDILHCVIYICVVHENGLCPP